MNKRFTLKICALVVVLAIILCGICACDNSNYTQFYSVTFNLDGGKVADKDLSAPLKVKDGTALNLAEYVPTKDGYDFAGWKVGDTTYQSDDKITVTADITLVAQWTLAVSPTFLVTFDVNGGSMDKDSQMQVDRNSIVNLADYVPTKDGYNFIGWKVDGKVYASDETYTVTSAVTLVAQWRIQPTDANKFTFEETQDGSGYVLTGFADGFDVENIAVPGVYNGKPIVEVKEKVFQYSQGIKTVDFTNCTSLVKIGANNFYYDYDVESVNLEGCSALVEIGNYCFNNCLALEYVSLAGCSSLKAIGNSCFNIAPKLTTVDLQGLTSLESIGSSSFSGYAYTQSSMYIPVQVLDFSDCVSLASIGQMSFWYLSEVKALDFSNTTLSVVDRQVIMGCSKLESVALPATLNPQAIANENLGINNLSEFIYQCDNLKEITVSPLSIYLCAEDGVLYDIDKTTVFKFPAKGQLTQYTAPTTVTTVIGRAFENASNLQSIDFSKCKLTEVAFNAFAGCTNATLSLPFDEYGYYQDGTQVTLGNNWNNGVKQINYAERYLYFDFTVTGITDGAKVSSPSIAFDVSAKYGDDLADIAVKLNGTAVSGTSGRYALELTVGENVIEITASFGSKSDTRIVRVEYVSSDPTITSTVEDGKIYTGSYIEFDIYAKDASGNSLDKSHITIKTNWGYGLNDLTSMAYTMTDNGDSIHVKIDFDMLWDWMYYDGGQFTLSLTVKDGDTSASVEYRIEHRQ